MRIIAGRLRGRIFNSPGGKVTHPMADKVRGALFNALGDIEGLSVLDAFTGSGALGFEAISRGAAAVVAIENDKSAQKTVAENIRLLEIDNQARLIRTTISNWLKTSPATELFDIIVCDPPYHDLQIETIVALCERLMPEGTLILSWPGKQSAPIIPKLDLAKQKSYGDAQLLYYVVS